MDDALHIDVRRTCYLPEMVFLGLHVQHGGQCRAGDRSEFDVELVQFREIQKIGAGLGDVAGTGFCVDLSGYEFRVVGFPSDMGLS